MPVFVKRVPEGDDRERLVCPDCGHIAYENPKIVVGSVIAAADLVLLCRRAIEPRRGYWTLPAGYLELGETIEEGARREAWEEARARIALEGILSVFSISRIGQVQIIFRAHFDDDEAGSRPSFSAGPESLDVRLFAWGEIPWPELAFPTVNWSLNRWRQIGPGPLGAPGGNAREDPRGVVPAGRAGTGQL